MEIYRWTDKDGKKVEYRFTDGICDGCFVDGELIYEQYTGRKMTKDWKIGLNVAGFKKQ